MDVAGTQLTEAQSNSLVNAFAGLAFGALIFLSIFLLVIIILTIIGKWKTYNKAGQHGWAAIIPFYTDFVLVKTAKMQWWHFLILDALLVLYFLEIKSASMVAGLAYFVYLCVINIKLSKAFKKGAGLGIVCTLFPFIGYMILGCGSAQYEGK